jgi:hypothetical protein
LIRSGEIRGIRDGGAQKVGVEIRFQQYATAPFYRHGVDGHLLTVVGARIYNSTKLLDMGEDPGGTGRVPDAVNNKGDRIGGGLYLFLR